MEDSPSGSCYIYDFLDHPLFWSTEELDSVADFDFLKTTESFGRAVDPFPELLCEEVNRIPSFLVSLKLKAFLESKKVKADFIPVMEY